MQSFVFKYLYIIQITNIIFFQYFSVYGNAEFRTFYVNNL